jgi:chorismate mutase
MKLRTAIVPVLAVLAGCAGPQGELASLAERRLALSPDIAWYKHSNDVPVYDPVRETSVLQTVMAAGQQQGLNPDTVRRFFAAEMEASRRIQWEWIHAWRKGRAEPFGTVRDLHGDLRPRMDAIGAEQIDALARGAQPLTIDQLSVLGARFLPKNSLSTPAHSAPSTPAVTSQR